MKQYLGDGVYIDFDGFHLILTTEDGVSVSNTIYIEFPSVFISLLEYCQRLRGEQSETKVDDNGTEKV
jgi:hypothetical protein